MKKLNILIVILILLGAIGSLFILLKKANTKLKENKLTINQIQSLVDQKHEKLTWSDFSGYKYTDIGSGVYLYEYIVEPNYKLHIGGKDLNTEPDYIFLFKKNHSPIDIRNENIVEYLKKGD